MAPMYFLLKTEGVIFGRSKWPGVYYLGVILGVLHLGGLPQAEGRHTMRRMFSSPSSATLIILASGTFSSSHSGITQPCSTRYLQRGMRREIKKILDEEGEIFVKQERKGKDQAILSEGTQKLGGGAPSEV